ncbi:MAG TPA: hypothetical protein VGW34_07830 [Allosphingosinicella sp.]|nr:hypothetical protein [Allosphingosinicella sp.]
MKLVQRQIDMGRRMAEPARIEGIQTVAQLALDLPQPFILAFSLGRKRRCRVFARHGGVSSQTADRRTYKAYNAQKQKGRKGNSMAPATPDAG